MERFILGRQKSGVLVNYLSKSHMREFDTLVTAYKFNAFSHQISISMWIILALLSHIKFHNVVVFTQLFFPTATAQSSPSVLTSKTTLAKQKGVTLLGYDWTPIESHKKFTEFCFTGMMGTQIKPKACTNKCSITTCYVHMKIQTHMWRSDTCTQAHRLFPAGSHPGAKSDPDPPGSQVKKFVFPGFAFIIYSWSRE